MQTIKQIRGKDITASFQNDYLAIGSKKYYSDHIWIDQRYIKYAININGNILDCKRIVFIGNSLCYKQSLILKLALKSQ